MAISFDEYWGAMRDKAVANKSKRAPYNKYIPRRVDDNQPVMVKAFRQLGAKVFHTHMVGDGFTDIVVAISWLNCLVEIKDGIKNPTAPSKRAFSPEEREFFNWWPGLKAVAINTQDAETIVKRMRFITQAVHTETNYIGNEEYRP